MISYNQVTAVITEKKKNVENLATFLLSDLKYTVHTFNLNTSGTVTIRTIIV